MSSDNEVNSDSSPSTHFVSQDGDEEILWEVLEITAEKPKTYRVKWAGKDPKTNKSWPQSWVLKHDCTDDLVLEWRRKQAKKKRGSTKRESVSSKKTHLSNATSRISTLSKDSTNSSSTIKRGRPSATFPPPDESVDKRQANGKRKRESVQAKSQEVIELTSDSQHSSTSRPRKKRRVEMEVSSDEDEPQESSFAPRATRVGKLVEPALDDEENVQDDEVQDYMESIASPHVSNKGKRKKEQQTVDSESDVPIDVLPPVVVPQKTTPTKKRTKASPRKKKSVKRKTVQFTQLNGAATPKKAESSPVSESTPISSILMPRKVPWYMKPQPLNLPNSDDDDIPFPSPVKRTKSIISSTIADASDGSKTKSNHHTSTLNSVLINPILNETTTDEDMPPLERRPPPTSRQKQISFRAPSLVASSLATLQLDHDSNTAEARPKLNTRSRSPLLSPAAKKRLAVFDAYLKHSTLPNSLERQGVKNGGRSSGNVQITAGLNVSAQPPVISDPSSGSSKISEKPSLTDQAIKSRPVVRPILRPPNNDVIPETEPESSTNNTQSQESQPGTIDPPSTPVRPSLKSKMRPRTPRGKEGVWFTDYFASDDMGFLEDIEDDHARQNSSRPAQELLATKPKTLGPIPVISPSKFTPHLSLSILPSTIEDAGEEEPMSSIEQFDSPDKSALTRTKQVLGNEKRIQPDEDESDRDVMKRGQEITAIARKEKLKEKGDAAGQNKPLDDIIDSKKNHARLVGQLDSEHRGDTSSEFDDEEQDTLTVEELEEAYVDLTGGVNEEQVQNDVDMEAIVLRQEEEESTQDLLGDAYVEKSLSEVEDEGLERSPKPDPEAHQPVNAVEQDKSQVIESVDVTPRRSVDRSDSPLLRSDDYLDVPIRPLVAVDEQPPHSQVVDELPASSPIDEHDDDVDDDDGDDELPQVNAPAGEELENQPDDDDIPLLPASSQASRDSMSRSNSPVDPNDIRDSIYEIPPTASATQSTMDHFKISNVENGPHENGFDHLGAAMTVLNAKSEEILKLENLLLLESKKHEALQKELERMKEEQALVPNERSSKEVDLQKELTEMQASFTAEKEVWIAERAALTTSLETANLAKASADKDRDFFREQYSQASGFVFSVRQENIELEKKATIAEGQAKTGVAMVKATFEQRVKFLEDDVKSWKRMANFLIEKDQRTNDDIRRRAAEEPELRVHCLKLEELLETAIDRTVTLQSALSTKEEELVHLGKEFEVLVQVKERLTAELCEVKAKLEVAPKSKIDGSGNGDHDMVYRCEWRPEGGSGPCEAVFLNTEDLRKHLYDDGHIHD